MPYKLRVVLYIYIPWTSSGLSIDWRVDVHACVLCMGVDVYGCVWSVLWVREYVCLREKEKGWERRLSTVHSVETKCSHTILIVLWQSVSHWPFLHHMLIAILKHSYAGCLALCVWKVHVNFHSLLHTCTCNSNHVGCSIHINFNVHLYAMYICWSLLSNQSFYRQIAGYQRGVGDCRVG